MAGALRDLEYLSRCSSEPGQDSSQYFWYVIYQISCLFSQENGYSWKFSKCKTLKKQNLFCVEQVHGQSHLGYLSFPESTGRML